VSESIPHLVLLGGGHSHAIALRQWGQALQALRPQPKLRISLISDCLHTPYSGMLPAHVAGVYDYATCHIDLVQLCQFAGVELVLSRVVGLDLAQQQVICADSGPIAFDWLSIDIGSTPQPPNPERDLSPFCLAAKPVGAFLKGWEQLIQRVCAAPHRPWRVAVVGGGAGGVELALATAQRLRPLVTQPPEIHLLQRGAALLPRQGPGVHARLQKVLAAQGITLHCNITVKQVKVNPDPANADPENPDPTNPDLSKNPLVQLITGPDQAWWVDQVLWVTQASAPDWVTQSGLAVDEQGFIQVDEQLRSPSHPYIFAAGDIASPLHARLPKAGVFAVRQGKILGQNWQRAIADQPLLPYHPQRHVLALLGCGEGRAIATWSRVDASLEPWGLSWGPTRWLWRLKDQIDRRFMAQFQHLPPLDGNIRPQEIAPNPVPNSRKLG
jgi:selenide, water dikinase